MNARSLYFDSPKFLSTIKFLQNKYEKNSTHQQYQSLLDLLTESDALINEILYGLKPRVQTVTLRTYGRPFGPKQKY